MFHQPDAGLDKQGKVCTLILLALLFIPASLAYLDTWADSDYTANPIWTVTAGVWTAAPQSLITSSGNPAYIVMNDTLWEGHNLGEVDNASWDLYAQSTGDTGFSTFYRIHFFGASSKAGQSGTGTNGYALKVGDSGNYDTWRLVKTNGAAFSDVSAICPAMPVLNNDKVRFIIYKVGSKINFSIYHNGVLKCNKTATDSTYTVNHLVFNLQDYGSGATGKWKYLNASWRNLTSYTGAPAITLSKNVFTFNETHRRIKKTAFAEGEEFFQGLNLTLSNGSYVSDSRCNVSFPNGNKETDDSVASFTLCNSGCSRTSYKSNITGFKTSLARRDTFHFKVCHVNTASKDLSVNVCGTAYNVPAASMRLCALGNSTIFLNSSSCITKGYMYAIFSNTAPASQAHRLSDLANDRSYTSFYLNMIYNTTSKSYRSNGTTEYYEHGAYNSNVSCSNANSAWSFRNFQSSYYIVNAPPRVFFGQLATNDYIKNLSLSLNSTKLDYSAGRWNWTPVINDNDLDWVKVTWFDNASNIIFTNSSRVPKTFKTRDALFVKKMFYYYSIFANDTAKNWTQQTIKFFLNDTIHPYCSGLTNKSVINGSTYYFNGTCVDENFYNLNITCNNGYHYNWTKLNTTSFSFFEPVLVSTTALQCKYNYCDAHTKKQIKEVQVTKSINNGELKFDNTILKFNKKIKDFKWEKKSDRYSFCFQPGEAISYVDVKIPSGCEPYASGIPGHLVCLKDQVWIDFVSPNADYVYTNDSVRLLLKGGLSEYCFNSLGKLNCVSDTTYFRVTVPPKNSTSVLKTNYCPDTGAGVGILAIIVFVVLLCLVLGLVFKIGILDFIAGIGMIVLSFTVIGCSTVFGVIFMCVGLVFMVLSFVM